MKWSNLRPLANVYLFGYLMLSANAADKEPIALISVLTDEEALIEAHDVELQGTLAYVAGKGGSIAIIDVANPQNPKLIWHKSDPELLNDAETVLPAPGRLFVGTQDFHSIDISKPTAPVIEATIKDRTKVDTINGMVRRGNYIFAASKAGFITAFDVSKPASPHIAGLRNVVQLDGLWKPHDVDLWESYLVVADPNEFGTKPGTLALFQVFDESGELLPDSQWRLIGKLSTEALKGANRVQVKDHYAYVAGSYFPKISQGRSLAKGVVIDLGDPTDPKEVAVVDFGHARGPNGLTIAGDVWFLAGGQTVDAFNISDPTHPRQLASFTSTKAFPTADDNAHDLVYRDGYLFVTGQGDHCLVILEIKNEAIKKLAE